MNLTNKRTLTVDLLGVIWFICCLVCCITGAYWAAPVVSVCQYLMFGMLIIVVLKNGLIYNADVIMFCLSIFLIGLICACYNTFKGYSYFNIVYHLRQTLYLCLFSYCGFYVSCYYKDTRLVFESIHLIATIASLIIILQYVLYILGIHVNRIGMLGDVFFHAVDTTRYFRPSAFFSEPSYFAEICLIDIFNNLFRKKNFKSLIIELIAIVCSASSLGIVFGYSLVVIWGCTQRISINYIINTIAKCLMVATLVAMFTLFVTYTGDNAIILRILNGATINQRTLRAFEIFGKLDNGHKILGIGLQNLANYLNAYSVKLIYDATDTLSNREFSQSFGYILCTLGIGGAAALLCFFLSMTRKIKLKYWGFLVLLCELMLTANMITRVIFTIYLAAFFQLVFDSQKEGW